MFQSHNGTDYTMEPAMSARRTEAVPCPGLISLNQVSARQPQFGVFGSRYFVENWLFEYNMVNTKRKGHLPARQVGGWPTAIQLRRPEKE